MTKYCLIPGDRIYTKSDIHSVKKGKDKIAYKTNNVSAALSLIQQEGRKFVLEDFNYTVCNILNFTRI